MSKNSKESVKQNIQELAIGNYTSYPKDYSPAKQETNNNIQSLAKGYWDSREIKEITRDEKLGIQFNDYITWTQEAYKDYVAHEDNAYN